MIWVANEGDLLRKGINVGWLNNSWYPRITLYLGNRSWAFWFNPKFPGFKKFRFHYTRG